MPAAARKRCNFPACDRGMPDEDGNPDCYTTPEGLQTRDQVSADLKEHVDMAHLMPIRMLEAEEKKLQAQANLVKAEADKLRAERPPGESGNTAANNAPAGSSHAGAKTEKIPRPTVDEGVSEGDWGFFVSQWKRYVTGTGISGDIVAQQLWAACTTVLQKSLHNSGAGNITDPKVLLDLIKSLAVQCRNNLVNIVELQGMAQNRDEKITAFSSRLNGKADLCDLVIDCPTCKKDVSFKEKILMYQLVRGLSDPDIQS